MPNKTTREGKMLKEQLDGSFAEVVSPASAGILRCTFAKTRASIDPEFFNTIGTIGAGHAVSQASGNLLIAAGTTAGSEALFRTKKAFSRSLAARIQMQASQRIAGNNLYLLLADAIGDDLAAVATSATNVDVTIPNNPFTAENIGQSLFMGMLAGGLIGVGGRYAIAAVNGNVVSFIVAGFTASSGTVSLFGWNFHQVLYNGTVATTAQYDAARKGWSSGNTAITTITSATPGHMILFGAEDGVGYVADQFTASQSFQLQVIPRGSRVANIADESADLYFYIWSINTTAPASSTTLTIGLVHVEEYDAARVAITQMRPQGRPAPLPVAIMESVSTLYANIGQIGASTLAAEDAAATATPLPIGGIARTANTPTTIINGDAIRATFALGGGLIQKPYAVPELTWNANLSLTTTTATALKAAAAAGIKNHITAGQAINTGASAVDLIILDGATERWRMTLPVNVPVPLVFPTELLTTAATALNANLSAAGTVRFCAQGYSAQ